MGTGPDGGPATLDDFDPSQDSLVVLYDPAGPPPTLACDVTDAGATLFADGLPVAFLPGAVEIDLATVRLSPA